MSDEQKIINEASSHMSALADIAIQFKNALEKAGLECIRLENRCKELEHLLSLKKNLIPKD